MLDNLLEIEVAYSLLKDDKSDSAAANPIDVHYERLKTNIVVSLCVCDYHSYCICDDILFEI